VSLSSFLFPTFLLRNTLTLINRERWSAICDPGPAGGCRDGREGLACKVTFSGISNVAVTLT
jgi:hypothetical protein